MCKSLIAKIGKKNISTDSRTYFNRNRNSEKYRTSLSGNISIIIQACACKVMLSLFSLPQKKKNKDKMTTENIFFLSTEK